MSDEEVALDLEPDQSCIILDVDGNVVEVILPNFTDDDFMTRGAKIATMLVTMKKEKLDALIEEWWEEHTK